VTDRYCNQRTNARRRTHPDGGNVVAVLAVVSQRLDGGSYLADLLVGPLHHDHLEHAAGVEVRVETRLPVGLQRRLLLHVPHLLAFTHMHTHTHSPTGTGDVA